MRRIASGVLVIALLSAVPAAAEPAAAEVRPKKAPVAKVSSTTKRAIWTAVGAGAGFAAGVFIGLNKFDDAINSDRKVWTTAIVGAAAGGVAGALLSRNVSRSVPVANAARPTGEVQVSWTEALHGPPPLGPLEPLPRP